MLDETGSYTNVDRIRNNGSYQSNETRSRSYLSTTPHNNTSLYRSNESRESRSRSYLSTIPCPNNNTPPPTSRCHNTHMGFNDRDVFRLNTQNLYHLNTSLFANDDNNARSICRSSSDLIPAPFHDMANIHQICSWLCANPNILLLSYNLYLSMQTPIANSFNLVTPNFNSATLTTSIPQELKQEDRVNITTIYFVISFCCYYLTTCIIQTKANRDFLEELKCLFLRARDPEKNAFEELVRQIFNHDLNSAEGIECLRTANRNFSDFRNKFLDNIEEAVNVFKKNRVR